MRWFRFYDDALNDKKVQRLAPHLFKTWVNLLCLASKGGGKIPSDDDISFELRISVSDAKQQLEDLILAGLIDICGDGSREPHNWKERQFLSDASTERVRKFRNKNKQADDETPVKRFSNGGVTPPESEPDTDTDTENKLQLSQQAAAKKKSELGFNSNSNLGSGKRDGMETLLRQAEGFGLDVEEMLEITNRNADKKKREGYFVTLCVNRLKDQLHGLDEQIIRDALNGKFEQTKTVTALLMGVTP